MECNKCYNECPMIGTQQLRTVNVESQSGNESCIIKLGEEQYQCGRALHLKEDKKICIGAPGLYYVYYAGEFKAYAGGDTLMIQPKINEHSIPGSGLYIEPPCDDKAFPAANTFFISVKRHGILTFEKTTTSAYDCIDGFTVSIYRVS